MSTPREPLSPDAVDALLSAQLDGELHDAARELGLSESEALAELESTPGIEARRVALTRARDLIAARSPLEPAVEDRLVVAAMARDDLALVRARRERRGRQWRALVAAGSVAAAIAVVVGVSTMQHDTSSKASKSALAPRSPSAATSAGAPKLKSGVNFGDVTHEAALSAPARGLLSRLPGADSVSGKQSTDKPLTPSSPQPLAAAADTTTTANGPEFRAAAPPACTAVIRRRYRIEGTLAITGTGTFSGNPVVILIFDGAGTPVAYVVSAADCSLVRRQQL